MAAVTGAACPWLRLLKVTGLLAARAAWKRMADTVRGHFPGDDAAMKLLYLGIRNITGRHIDGDGLILERGLRGTGTYGWKAAMNAFSVAFPDRVPV